LYKKTTAVTSGSIQSVLTECGDIAVGPVVPVGPEEGSEIDDPYIITVPSETLPPELDGSYTDSTLLPGRLTVEEANEENECCDCRIE
jgi:hypothetical protein